MGIAGRFASFSHNSCETQRCYSNNCVDMNNLMGRFACRTSSWRRNSQNPRWTTRSRIIVEWQFGNLQNRRFRITVIGITCCESRPRDLRIPQPSPNWRGSGAAFRKWLSRNKGRLCSNLTWTRKWTNAKSSEHPKKISRVRPPMQPAKPYYRPDDLFGTLRIVMTLRSRQIRE